MIQKAGNSCEAWAASLLEWGDLSVISFMRVNAPLFKLVERDETIVAPDKNKDGSWGR